MVPSPPQANTVSLPAGDRVTRVDGGFMAGAADGEFGVNAGRLDDADRDIEFAVAALAFAAGIWIEQNGGFAHAPRPGDIVSASRQFSVKKRVTGYGSLVTGTPSLSEIPVTGDLRPVTSTSEEVPFS